MVLMVLFLSQQRVILACRVRSWTLAINVLQERERATSSRSIQTIQTTLKNPLSSFTLLEMQFKLDQTISLSIGNG